MKTFITYLKDFIQTDFNWKTYSSIFLFLSIAIFTNYYFDLKNSLFDCQKNSIFRFLLYLSLYSTAYYGTLTIYLLTTKINYFNNKSLLIKSFSALLLIAFDSSFKITAEDLSYSLSFASEQASYCSKILNLLLPIVAYIIGFFILRNQFDKNAKHLYGLTTQDFHWKPYSLLLFIMVPFIAIASFQADFTTQYPFFKYWLFEPSFGLTQKQQFYAYESLYLFNFVNIELLFRGVLVIGMVHYLGPKAILPMIVTYTFLHFGKPPLEAISSALGGYILGVIAFRTTTIFGGILLHIGIALLMDLFAIQQLRNPF